jgi:dTDP-L-rhamnose 4-epimerase
MLQRVLITGGAGFIGTRLARELVSRDIEVRVLDSFLPQVHGPDAQPPRWLERDCDLRIGDIRDRRVVWEAVRDVDAIVHLAADTGTGQSMTEIHRYTDVNAGGTAMLLECLLPHTSRLQGLVLASSRSVYGEGKYECERCGIVYPGPRSPEALAASRWEPPCPTCAGPIESRPTDEDSVLRPGSIYGATKLAQEQLVTTFGSAAGMPVTVLRYQNVYGAGQSLGNPYTGILTHFFCALHRGSAPRVFEDGLESRDFVHVSDVVRATASALASASSGIFNVGTGASTSILELARSMCRLFGSGIEPVVVPEYRVGDIRHCVADLRRTARELDFAPRVPLESGLREFVEWAHGVSAEAQLRGAGLPG